MNHTTSMKIVIYIPQCSGVITIIMMMMKVVVRGQGPVVRRLFSANSGLNFNPGFFFFRLKVFSRIIFSIFLEHPITKVSIKRIRLNSPGSSSL